ncbi:DUF4479 and tRNA-binding domain-containing protein [Bombilactobacillus folatiphilus]|uniref:DUF4479 and tRNA-binding domain-containing protein n=1 Tax=Bombilactobacillus folatiphilus TaxID=2923362 RepID=A0ABY4PAV2_9LACO|nr:DUF4479 domain-containing protein [Bombilactobacillus folatiphilus]UQS82641.1 DUF4479 and tRNA-binding domain-containing protein [Bombilactobacillus folatiphilus]
MQISVYNPSVLGNALLITLGADTTTQTVIQKEQIVQILDDQNQVIGYNFLEIVPNLQLDPEGSGQVHLTAPQITVLNDALQAAGFDQQLQFDPTQYFVAGLVKKMQPHPDSDHLHICQIELDQAQTVQIVCGAPNIEVGQIVAVAKVGAMMPDGKIIYSGVLRGVPSEGMVCAPRELQLKNAPQKRGILVLDDQTTVGSPLDFAALNQLY